MESRPLWTTHPKIHALCLTLSLGSPWHVSHWLVVDVTGVRKTSEAKRDCHRTYSCGYVRLDEPHWLS